MSCEKQKEMFFFSKIKDLYRKRHVHLHEEESKILLGMDLNSFSQFSTDRKENGIKIHVTTPYQLLGL